MSTRPHWRWVIIGPARSGSTFHKDPNGTCAWNAPIVGRKKWIFLPPDCPPPGVHASEDGGSVAAPLSLGEWFIDYYSEYREWLKREGREPLECICSPGDAVFVPQGWWHCALNLDTPCVAVT